MLPPETVKATRVSEVGATVPAESTISKATSATSPGAAGAHHCEGPAPPPPGAGGVGAAARGEATRGGGTRRAHFRRAADRTIPFPADGLVHPRLVGHVPADVQVVSGRIDSWLRVRVP